MCHRDDGHSGRLAHNVARRHSGLHSSYCGVIAAQQRTSGLIIHEYKITTKHRNLYKTAGAVVILHQALRQGRNYRDRHKIVEQGHEIPLGSRHRPRLDSASSAGETYAGSAGSVRPRRCHDGIEDEAERACRRHLLRFPHCSCIRNVLIGCKHTLIAGNRDQFGRNQGRRGIISRAFSFSGLPMFSA